MKKILSIIIIITVLVICIKVLPGSVVPPAPPALPAPVRANAIKHMFGVNCYEWDFLNNPHEPNNVTHVYAAKFNIIKNFNAVRHYLDWSKIEAAQGEYTFNPTHDGGWSYDAVYQACKQNRIEVVTCLKTCPQWLVNTYPPTERDNENVPAPYGLNRSDPASYILQARAGFQFAARYGYNQKVDPALVKVNSKPRWTADPVNEAKIGMGLVKYIECDNERDKWWKGKKAQQTGSEYAANLSAFYDGNKGKLGKGVGVKSADPNMLVVMAGLASANPKFLEDMIAWCVKNRGYKPDGNIDLCFDIINYHFYSNDHAGHSDGQSKKGIAPELSEGGKVADNFVAIANRLKQHPPVWITETGFDFNPGSPQAAIAIGNKNALATQADWLLRTAFLFNRHGITRTYFYQLYDDNQSAIQYGTSGVADGKTLQRRPTADYVLQVTKLMGDYLFKQTISTDPLVDVYQLGQKKIYVLMIPDQVGRTGHYLLNIAGSKSVIVHKLKIGTDEMTATEQPTVNGQLDVPVSETPIFIEVQ